MKYFFACLFFLCLFKANAQSIDGNWKGELTQGSSIYTLEININQSGDKLSGTSKITLLDNYVIEKFSGLIHNGAIEINETEVIKCTKKKSWYWCVKNYFGKLLTDSIPGEYIINGNWNSKKIFLNPGYSSDNCPPGTFRVSKAAPGTNTPIEPVTASKNDSVILNNNVMQDLHDEVMTREIEIIKTVDVVSDSVDLQFYDNGSIDNDTITVYYNDEILFSKLLLKEKPFIIKIPVLPGRLNKIIMFADNLGDIPPNTALLVFYDQGHRRELTLSSTLSKSEAIILRKRTN